MEITNTGQLQNPADALKMPGNDAASLKNEFMTLMIAQIKNQDPTKPINSAEYVSQLAQFSQVESLEKMRDNQSSQMVMMENLGIVQSASLVGKSAMVPASGLQLSDEAVDGKVFLENAVEDLDIQILNQQGTVVKTVKLGAQQAGDIRFSLDPKALGLTEGKYELKASATLGDSALIAPTYIKAQIEKIHFSSASGMMMAEMGHGLGVVSVLNISEVS
ncbi:flagellar hook assembly protein FlgD [Shewanella salipaludis]|uniref:Basal-body rod modification protein FlgD n=1 Tax=Shewanella salipaludis TaxID=2723052 RepID=A0A972G3V9_9GAMM|nr:flagellar hook capping FlgD N-terminal domain-containing protein [Shewanella salipaludis]NMH66734.1 flagellar biosynthesis protein FlgD [Shewanella salipaludis]